MTERHRDVVRLWATLESHVGGRIIDPEEAWAVVAPIWLGSCNREEFILQRFPKHNAGALVRMLQSADLWEEESEFHPPRAPEDRAANMQRALKLVLPLVGHGGSYAHRMQAAQIVKDALAGKYVSPETHVHLS